ncbi:MAG: RNA polymerase sigma factor [Planctomycetia bacterium]|nr:RNA polymerase sigma factor [Planctomycetia bacterium]
MSHSRESSNLFEGMVRDHAAELYRYAYRLLGNTAWAEDLVQETFFHAWKSIRSLDDPSRARAWLYTILRRRWMRSQPGARAPLPSDGVVQARPDEGSPTADPQLICARRESIQAALGTLDPRLRETFLLVFQSGFTCREVAERLAVPLGTVLSRVHRARVGLRSALATEGSRVETDRSDARIADGGRA